jgi:hypothetical protein
MHCAPVRSRMGRILARVRTNMIFMRRSNFDRVYTWRTSSFFCNVKKNYYNRFSAEAGALAHGTADGTR